MLPLIGNQEVRELIVIDIDIELPSVIWIRIRVDLLSCHLLDTNPDLHDNIKLLAVKIKITIATSKSNLYMYISKPIQYYF